MPSDQYGPSFQRWLDQGSTRSAEVIVPLVCELVHPSSVVDIGCGNGNWLAEFRRLGAQTVLGVDGDYVDRESLRISPGEFVAHDLSQPFETDRTFDLALSLETAEHLPASCAAMFVEQLTQLAPVVVFSAAVPYQGGVGHVNEQWPEYWAERFSERAYVTVDCLRAPVWNHPEVEFWYAQNLLLFVDASRIESYPELARRASATDATTLSRVHPAGYLAKVEHPDVNMKALIRAASGVLKRGRRLARARP